MSFPLCWLASSWDTAADLFLANPNPELYGAPAPIPCHFLHFVLTAPGAFSLPSPQFGNASIFFISSVTFSNLFNSSDPEISGLLTKTLIIFEAVYFVL